MTEEDIKLKKAIRLLITYYDGEGDIVDGIITLIREAGWKSPEEVEKLLIKEYRRGRNDEYLAHNPIEYEET